jgi:hypothetical protein
MGRMSGDPRDLDTWNDGFCESEYDFEPVEYPCVCDACGTQIEHRRDNYGDDYDPLCEECHDYAMGQLP